MYLGLYYCPPVGSHVLLNHTSVKVFIGYIKLWTMKSIAGCQIDEDNHAQFKFKWTLGSRIY